ncbi:MAG: adenosylcobinamide-GDP ribazoletransferase [Deltaproteobacteria bacterium]|nr:adenosylcobinamide-GDP ribazoletransferase [Deltaproteobacteria bacterium]
MNSTLPLALTFLTKLPWPWRGPADETALARSMFWFPWVGALLGIIFWVAWAGLQKMLPAPAAAALLLTLTVWVTGGLHLDGLADTADGLGGGHTPEEALFIMKDSRVGAFGVISLILGLVLKFSLFLSLATQTRGAGALLLFPIISRWSMVLLAYLSPYARAEGGLGQAMTLGVSPRVLMGASLSAGALALLILGAPGLVIFIAAAALVWLGSLYFQRRLGGITGDILGATNEVVEIMVLAGALMLT